MLDSSRYSPDRSVGAKLKRRMTQWRCVDPLKGKPKRAIVSFTFDDFPRSAALNGAQVLEDHGARGTYYVASGMARQTNVMGEMFGPEDLVTLSRNGHEIGGHTHLHLDCSRVTPAQVVEELKLNCDTLRAYGLKRPVTQFAWPYGETDVDAKRALIGKVESARGILPGINRKGADLMQLRAFELSPDEATLVRAETAIREAAKSGGWVILFTHDVRAKPSAFGTRPEVLSALAKLAHERGAAILPVSEALAEIRSPAGAVAA